jgi:hypothetical protein
LTREKPGSRKRDSHMAAREIIIEKRRADHGHGGGF